MNEYLIKLQSAMVEVKDEIVAAKSKHRDFSSHHEAYAVIMEEVDELWDEIKKKEYDVDKMRTEAIQATAMLCRFLVELL